MKHAFDDDLPGPKGSPAKKTNRKKTGRTGILTSINADVVAVTVNEDKNSPEGKSPKNVAVAAA